MKYSVAAMAMLAATASADEAGFAMWSKNPRAVSARAKQQSTSANRVVNGYAAEQGRYPYMVGLFESATEELPVCGGTLIAPNVVLTAAHCEGGITHVSVGCFDAENADSEPNCERIAVAETRVNPAYVTDANEIGYNDNMILILARDSQNAPISFLSDAAYEDQIPDGTTVRIMGWGGIFSGGPQSTILLQSEVNIINRELCASVYEPELPGTSIDDSMICAAALGRDTCQGDSGGPLVIPCDLTGEDILIADVSWGFGCADPFFPGVYASIGHVMNDFIKPIVEAQGHNVTFSADLPVDYCTVGGTLAPTSPTPPPTFAAKCTGFIGEDDGCDCGCTDEAGTPIYDPDCETPGAQLYDYCSVAETCDITTGVCIYAGGGMPGAPTSTNAPTPGVTTTNAPTPGVTTTNAPTASVTTVTTLAPTFSSTTSTPGDGEGSNDGETDAPLVQNVLVLVLVGVVAGVIGALAAIFALKLVKKPVEATTADAEVKADPVLVGNGTTL